MSIVKIGPFNYIDSNVYLITGEHPIVVDAGTGSSTDAIISEIRRFSSSDPELIVATHCHYDHVGGLAQLMEAFDCPAVAGWRDAPYIRSADPLYTVSGLFESTMSPAEVGDVRSGDTISSGEHTFQVIETPGHTPGGICLYEGSTGYLISGDVLFSNGFGRTDFTGGSMSDLRESLRLISNIDIRGLFPGHGNVCEHYNPEYLSGILRMVGV